MGLDDFFRSPNWCRALTQPERLDLIQSARANDDNDQIARNDVRHQTTGSQSIGPVSEDGSYFPHESSIDEFAGEIFSQMLDESAGSIQEYSDDLTSWLQEIFRAFAESHDLSTLIPPETLEHEDVGKFLIAMEPLVCRGYDRLNEGLQVLRQKHTIAPFGENLGKTSVLTGIAGRLVWMIYRTMVLELHVARLQGTLDGETPEARFDDFIRRLGTAETALFLLHEYPVLARQTVLAIDQWVETTLEFLDRLCADWKVIRATLSAGQDPGLLVNIQYEAGDRHRGGRSVLIAEFDSGLQFVYKPRSVTVDRHFQELLTWLNDQGVWPPFRPLKIVDRGTYGWVEYLDSLPCRSHLEVRRFYERQGGLLALLYVLRATDIHFENLIALGEHPMLVDLETIFHPAEFEALPPHDAETSGGSVERFLANSVLRVGLLPTALGWNRADLSGLGAKGNQTWPWPVLGWEGAGTDEMQVVRREAQVAEVKSRPSLDGKAVDMAAHVDALIVGFTNMYTFLLANRDRLIALDGPLMKFAGDELRVLLRPTHVYGFLLQESFHPDLLRDSMDREDHFDQLWSAVEQRPALAEVISSERHDLQLGDIPIFTTRAGARDVWSSGNVRIAGLLGLSPMAQVELQVGRLSQEDLQRQLWILRAAIGTSVANEGRVDWPSYPRPDPLTGASHERLLAAAEAIGDRLEMMAIEDGQGVTWTGLAVSEGPTWSISPLGNDLYSGLPGIALFLAHLGAVTGQERYTVLARAALETVRQQFDSPLGFRDSIGAFVGWGSLIYTLYRLGMLWNESALISEAHSFVKPLSIEIAHDNHFDVMRGAAGAVLSLLALHRSHPSELTLKVAIQCGDWLLTHSRPMNPGVGWTGSGSGGEPLAGFSHGAAGIACALFQLAAAADDPRFLATAHDAIAYERSLFSPEAGNWQDLRIAERAVHNIDQVPSQYQVTWCHGAPGIGLARLATLEHDNDTETQADISAALATTLAHGFGFNHSLCHGDLGNLELLLEASRVLGRPDLTAETYRLAAGVLDSIERHGWICGVPLGVEVPGLMTGLAGVGYALLRIMHPNEIPSVLTLQSPGP